MNSETGISIIIPTHQGSKRIVYLLDSISKILKPSVLKFEIIIVSNMTDFQLENVVLNSYSELNVRLLITGKIGINAARNRGLDAAIYDICFFTDDDCRFLRTNELLNLCGKFYKFQAAAIGGFLVPNGRTTVFGLAYYIGITAWLLRYHNPTNSHAYRLVGGCFAVSKSKIGFLRFDESYVLGGDETPFILKLIELKKPIILYKELQVAHNFNQTIFEMTKKAYSYGKSFHLMDSNSHFVFPEQKKSYAQIEQILIRKIGRKNCNEFFLNLAVRWRNYVFDLSKIKKHSFWKFRTVCEQN